MIMIYKQKKIKIKPRIKLNHNIYIISAFAQMMELHFVVGITSPVMTFHVNLMSKTTKSK